VWGWTSQFLHKELCGAAADAMEQVPPTGTRVKAIHLYERKAEQELSIEKNEILTIEVAKPGKAWWKVSNDQGEIGYVPCNYVQVLDETPEYHAPQRPGPLNLDLTGAEGGAYGGHEHSPFDGGGARLPNPPRRRESLKGDWGSGGLGSSPPRSPMTHKAMELRQSLAQRMSAEAIVDEDPIPTDAYEMPEGIETGAKFDSGVALYDFEPSQTDELRLRQDETMLILQDFGDGWLRVRITDGSEGFVPQGYVQIVQGREAAAPQPTAGPVMFAQFSYQPQQEGDLEVFEGEELYFLEQLDAEWVRVARATGDGAEGVVPAGYVAETAPPPPGPPGPPPLHTYPWYHHDSSRRDAERLLFEQGRGTKGIFLVRPSQEVPGDLSVSVNGGDKVKHFKIHHRPESNDYLFGDRVFETVPELVLFYQTYSIFTTAQGHGIVLSHPAAQDTSIQGQPYM